MMGIKTGETIPETSMVAPQSNTVCVPNDPANLLLSLQCNEIPTQLVKSQELDCSFQRYL